MKNILHKGEDLTPHKSIKSNEPSYEWLVTDVCEEIELGIVHCGLETPKEVWKELIQPMKKEGTYSASLLEEAFVRVMEIYWHINPSTVFQLIK